MKYTLVIIAVCLINISIFSCNSQIQIANQDKTEVESTHKIEQLLKQLSNSNGPDVLVIAHRGDWRNFPENSLEGFSSAIDMGVDMIEMDVAKTKDNQLVIMHDHTLDRTTNGKGLVSDWTLDALRKLYLKDGLGIETKCKIPTLEEALLICRDKSLVNLDKSYEIFNQAFDVAKKTGTTKQIVMKGYNKTANHVMSDFGTKLDTITFMPIINLDNQPNALQIIEDYQTKLKVKAFEIVFSKDTSKVLTRFSEIKKKGSRIWVNSLWASLNAGHEDNEGVKNKDNIYGWYIENGVNMIQTDRPQLLINYLRNKKKHK